MLEIFGIAKVRTQGKHLLYFTDTFLKKIKCHRRHHDLFMIQLITPLPSNTKEQSPIPFICNYLQISKNKYWLQTLKDRSLVIIFKELLLYLVMSIFLIGLIMRFHSRRIPKKTLIREVANKHCESYNWYSEESLELIKFSDQESNP